MAIGLVFRKQVPSVGQGGSGVNRNSSAFKDSAFIENRTAPIHRWVPWIAGFSASFVDSVLSAYLGGRRPHALVLDPFAGVGTTLTQAAMRGYNVVGFEINPYAGLAAQVKLNAFTVDTEKLRWEIEAARRDSSAWRNGRPDVSMAPLRFRSRIPFFSPAVERQVLRALHFIEGIGDQKILDLFRVAFGSVMVSFSNYTYEPSLSSRPGAGKSLVKDADVAGTLLSKLFQMVADIEWLKKEMKGHHVGRGVVYNEDFFEGSRGLTAQLVSLIVTSPPYLNNYHYVRNTRPQLYWLSFITSPEEQRPLEEKNFGTYWQVARDKDEIKLTFEHTSLNKTLDVLRNLRQEAGHYGGYGWANYATSYFNDCDRFVATLKRVLVRGGVGVVVVGNSIIQGIEIKVEEILSDIVKRRGLLVEGIHRLRGKRTGNSITASSVRRGVSMATLYESAVVIRKR